MKKWKVVTLAAVSTVAALVLAVPFVLDAFLPQKLVQQIEGRVEATAHVEKVSTSWFRPLRVEGLSIEHAGTKPLQVASISVNKTLGGLVLAAFSDPLQAKLGIEIAGLEGSLEELKAIPVKKSEKTVEENASYLPLLESLAQADLQVRFQNAHLKDASNEVVLDTLSLGLSGKTSRLAIRIDAEGTVDPSQAKAPLSVNMAVDCPLEKLRALLKQEEFKTCTLFELLPKLSCKLNMERLMVPIFPDTPVAIPVGLSVDMTLTEAGLKVTEAHFQTYPVRDEANGVESLGFNTDISGLELLLKQDPSISCIQNEGGGGGGCAALLDFGAVLSELVTADISIESFYSSALMRYALFILKQVGGGAEDSENVPNVHHKGSLVLRGSSCDLDLQFVEKQVTGTGALSFRIQIFDWRQPQADSFSGLVCWDAASFIKGKGLGSIRQEPLGLDAAIKKHLLLDLEKAREIEVLIKDATIDLFNLEIRLNGLEAMRLVRKGGMFARLGDAGLAKHLGSMLTIPAGRFFEARSSFSDEEIARQLEEANFVFGDMRMQLSREGDFDRIKMEYVTANESVILDYLYQGERLVAFDCSIDAAQLLESLKFYLRCDVGSDIIVNNEIVMDSGIVNDGICDHTYALFSSFFAKSTLHFDWDGPRQRVSIDTDWCKGELSLGKSAGWQTIKGKLEGNLSEMFCTSGDAEGTDRIGSMDVFEVINDTVTQTLRGYSLLSLISVWATGSPTKEWTPLASENPAHDRLPYTLTFEGSSFVLEQGGIAQRYTWMPFGAPKSGPMFWKALYQILRPAGGLKKSAV